MHDYQIPKKSDSTHFCFLKKISIILMAIVDTNHKFICIDVGGYTKNSIFDTSAMEKKL